MKMFLLVLSLLIPLSVSAQQFTPGKDGITEYCNRYYLVADSVDKMYKQSGYTKEVVIQVFADILLSMGEHSLVIKAEDIMDIITSLYDFDVTSEELGNFCARKYKSLI